MVRRDRLRTGEISPRRGRNISTPARIEGEGPSARPTLGHTFGDAPAFWYPFLWANGWQGVEADGKTVVLNSKATVDSVKLAVSAWKGGFDEGGLAWDDSNNNRAFLSGTIASTLNGASIYIESKRKADSYKTDKARRSRMTSFMRRCRKARPVSSATTYHSRTC